MALAPVDGFIAGNFGWHAASVFGFTLGLSGIGRSSSDWLPDRFSSRYVSMLFFVIALVSLFLWELTLLYGAATALIYLVFAIKPNALGKRKKEMLNIQQNV